MKYTHLAAFLITALLAGTTQARAEVFVGVGIGDRPPGVEVNGSWGHRGYRYHRHDRPVVVSPVVVVPAPYYGGYGYPVYIPPAPPPPVVQGLTGNYGTDLADLNERLSRFRSIVQRQNQKGSISQAQYDRFMNELDGIEHDEHVRAFDRGGNLTQDDFADLYRRLDQAGEDIEIALAQ